MNDRGRVVIVGAGLAGLRAALELSRRGWRVKLLEKRGRPGGRIRRVGARGRPEEVDCGQHLMLGCYRHTLELAELVGTRRQLLPVRGATPFVSQPGRIHPFRVGRGPAPLHLLPALLGLDHLDWSTRLGMARAGLAAKLGARLWPERLDRLSASAWLRWHGQGRQSRRGLWEPLGLATLNIPLEQASARMFATVLDRSMFAGRRDITALLPEQLLDDVFVRPALEKVRRQGGEILCSQRVVRLQHNGRRLLAVETADGRRHQAEAFVLAAPWYETARLAGQVAALDSLGRQCARLGYSGIVTVDIWYDRCWLEWSFAGLLHSPLQWVFSHPRQRGLPARVSCVISGAERLLAWPSQRLVAECRAELVRHFPAAAAARVVDSLVTRVPLATIRVTPGSYGNRPGPATALENLYLAGDWTATGLPATMEGAVASGVQAARMLDSRPAGRIAHVA